ncbi:MAG: ABC transporter permease subunit [Candidatus Puniceispirillum sp.]|nr:ABC transporter permease subunit [Candidatus Puniceispirillum sp.]
MNATQPKTSQMTMIMAAARHEWRQLTYSPLTIIFQVGFLLTLATAIFVNGDFFTTDLVVMDLQWTFLPWIANVFIPALAMRAFHGQNNEGAMELTLSLPLSTVSITVGKWITGSFILLITLAMTLPFALTIAYLGSPDWGIVIAGYIGASLLLSSAYAVSMLAAALCREQIAAFVLGLGFLLLLMLLDSGLGELTILPPALQWVADTLYLASPRHWLDEMADGRIDLAGLVYFMALIGLSLAATSVLLARFRRNATLNLASICARISLVAGGIIAIMGLSGLLTNVPIALDLTQQKSFSLHAETIHVVKQTRSASKTPIEIKLFYNKNETPVPARIRQHVRRVESLLDQFESYAEGGIKISKITVEPDTITEESAILDGIQRVPMSSGDSLYFGATFQLGDRHAAISYFDERRAELLEYDLALAVSNLARKTTPKIGILSSLFIPRNVKEPRPGLAILEELKNQFDIAIIPYFGDSLPNDLDALLVIDTPVLKTDMLRSIDAHVMAGKGLMVMVDPHQRLNRGNAKLESAPISQTNIFTINDLLAAYGIRFDQSQVIGDNTMAATVVGNDGNQINYPYWLRVRRDAISTTHSTTADLNELLFAEAGYFTLSRPDNSDLTISSLITTSIDSGSQDRKVFRTSAPDQLAASFKADEGGARSVAIHIAGSLPTAFGGDSRAVSASVFAIADTDWIYDPMSLQGSGEGGAEFLRPLNDNFAFMLNMVEFLAGDSRLLGIRSRGNLVRSFTLVETMMRDAQQVYKDTEANFINQIAKVEGSITEVLSITGAKSVDELPTNLQNQIRDLQTMLLPLRQKLRQIRRSMRQDVEHLFQQATIVNIVAGPLLALMLNLLFWYRRKQS